MYIQNNCFSGVSGEFMIRQFDFSEFDRLNEICCVKERAGLKISLVIPALNESATIGPVVAGARRALIDEVPFLDEIIVIEDGRSNDGTRNAAIGAGAKVFCADEILTQMSIPPGKGASLWKSLFVTSGDIVVCVDADILNFDPRFVYGVAAPLVIFPELSFIKAFYDRPLEVDGTVLDHQGGRVTELMVRPLLSMFYSELAGIYQPLAGEYAFRRNVAEKAAFFSGYSVEIGLILDIARSCGISHIAQVDMGVRRHRNRSIRELGKMSFCILEAMIARFSEYGMITLNTPTAKKMLSPGGDAGFEASINQEIELPAASAIKRGNT
jgi:glucosyl-3-phosphoglycerate synthase